MRIRPAGPPGSAVLTRTALALGLLVAGALLAPVGGASPPSTAVAPPSFTLSGAAPVAHLAPTFFGADARIFYPANTTLARAYSTAGLSTVVWPGGAVADQYDLLANRIVREGGGSDTPPTSFAQFAAWCAGVHCQAIVQLPGEIDDPAVAAEEVAYMEGSFGFHPSYFEIGNEPALWTHFGVPWSQWTTAAVPPPTPVEYAGVVHAYILAVRAVDPSARFLGLPGVGTGAASEPTWIAATVTENGPNLSGVGIHVYPAGPGVPGHDSLTQFLGSLQGAGSLPSRVAADRAAITAAIRGSSRPIPIFVTELGSGNGGGAYTPFMASYPEVPYIATELIQAMALNVSDVSLFALEGTYPGSILGPSSTLSQVGALYDSMVARSGGTVFASSLGSVSPGLDLLVVSGRAPGGLVLWAVNDGSSGARTIELAGSGFPQTGGVAITVGPHGTQPVTTVYPAGIPASFSIPSEGVLFVTTSAPA